MSTSTQKEFRAITLHQPWATLIALGIKTIETRSWCAPKSLIGQRIAIHAGKKKPSLGDRTFAGDYCIGEATALLHHSVQCVVLGTGSCNEDDGYRRACVAMSEWYPALFKDHGSVGYIEECPLPLGCVVATATLEACLPIFDRFGSFATDDNPLWAYACDHGWLAVNFHNPHLERPIVCHRPPAVGQRNGWKESDLSEQLPYGDYSTDFTPRTRKSRWAWMLTDIEPLADPVPAVGKQGIWKVEL